MMDNDRWRQVEAICQSALDLPVADRAAFLHQSCGDDLALRAEIEQLIEQEDEAKRFLGSVVGALTQEPTVATSVWTPGQRINDLEIMALLATGGMGEIYKALDRRLGREVAVKVLPRQFASDPARLERFEQEIRIVASLNHPNIVVVHDVGSADAVPYVVTELLTGEDLRHRLNAGPLSEGRAIALAIEVARGLGAAHGRGIIHRDIKPENLFITDDGRLKIVDFGLAKASRTRQQGDTRPRTERQLTGPQVLLGTAGYMSPEQIRGEGVDHRSDLFAVGLVLYEMLSGRRAFQGASAIDVMSATLHEAPPTLSSLNTAVSPALERVVWHCLQKDPDTRFQSAYDLALALDAVSAPRTGTTPTPAVSFPDFRRITFQRGNVLHARFTPDGQSVVYSAAWDGRPCELFITRIDGRESRRLGVPNADILSVSRSGELAILLKHEYLSTTGWGTLARLPIGGGAPRELLENVQFADWGPGNELGVIRLDDQVFSVEYPLGRCLHTMANYSVVRVSPDGRMVAIVEGAGKNKARAVEDSLMVVDQMGGKRILARGLDTIRSVAWNRSGDEVVFMHKPSSSETAISAVTMDGQIRNLVRLDGRVYLCDLSADGRLLLRRENWRLEGLCGGSDAVGERDLSWLDASAVCQLSEDGRRLWFTEIGGGGGLRGSIYQRDTSGGEPIFLGEGYARSVSSDGKWVLAIEPGQPPNVTLLPTGVGRARHIPTRDLVVRDGAFLTPDRILLCGGPISGDVPRLYIAGIDGAEFRQVTDCAWTAGIPSPDGSHVALTAGAGISLFPVSGGDAIVVPGIERREEPLQWSDNGAYLYVCTFGHYPIRVFRVAIDTGERSLHATLMPSDPTGLTGVTKVYVTRNGRYYAYSSARVTSSELFVADGLL